MVLVSYQVFVKKREEIVRRLLILVMYGSALYKICTWPQTHYLFDAIIEGKDGFKPYVVILGLIIALGLIHKGINWVFMQGNR